MHGRRKAEHQAALLARSEAEKEAAKNKVLKYKQLATLALQQRREAKEQEGNPTITTRNGLEEALTLSAQLLRVNPDVYTLWNHRKEAIVASQVVRHELEEADTGEAEGAGESAAPSTSFLKTELGLIAECIQKNPKSYGAWHHRRWLLEHAFPCTASSSSSSFSSSSSAAAAPPPQLVPTLDKELALCAQLLDLDERNFHCWNYRRWVVSQHPGRSATDEFEFSTARIYKNFSNYSAFHHRAAYLPGYLQESKQSSNPRPVLKQELDMVQQAFFTEPDDQTAWWYHQYLISLVLKEGGRDGGKEFVQEMLEGEVEVIRGLAEEGEEEEGREGGGYRWAVLTLASLLRQLAATKGEKEGEEGREEGEALLEESRGLFERLERMDPDHAKRYESIVASSF